MKGVIALQASIGISVWFVQNEPFPAWLLTSLNRFFPVFAETGSATDLQRYFLLVTFLGLTGMIFAAVFAVLLVFKKRLDAPIISRKLLLGSYAFLLLSVTTCVYCTDFLQIGPGQESTIWYGGTEDYVNYRIENSSLSFAEDLQTYGGFIYGKPYGDELVVYLSQTGFYTSLLKLSQSITQLPPADVLRSTRILCSFLTAALLTAASLKFKKHFGLLSSLIFSALSLVTYWLLGPASHLIWYFPVSFIPLGISIFLYPKVINGVWTFRRFLWMSLLGYILVYLRSYDYAPVMVLSGAIPVFFYEINRRENWKTILWCCIQVCLIGLLGLALVMGVHFIQLSNYLGSTSQAVDYLVTKAIFRSAGGDTNLQTPLQIFERWLTVRVIYLPPDLFSVFPQWEEPVSRINTFGHLHRFAFAATLYAFALLSACKLSFAKNWLSQPQQNRLLALSLTTLASLLASWSWFPALGHMSHHYHMNGIMYIIPFGLTAYLLFGVLVEYSFQLLLQPRK
jgi:hypothetical protein